MVLIESFLKGHVNIWGGYPSTNLERGPEREDCFPPRRRLSSTVARPSRSDLERLPLEAGEEGKENSTALEGLWQKNSPVGHSIKSQVFSAQKTTP